MGVWDTEDVWGVQEVWDYIKKVEFVRHCIHCQGIDESISNPKHHPTYEITHRCNLNCVFCYSRPAVLSNVAPKPGFYGDTENVKSVTISQFGEPLLYPEKVAYVIDRLKEMFGDIRIDIQTNGVFLKEALPLLEDRVNLVMVSLDSDNAANYATITGGNFFDRVIEAIKLLGETDIYGIVRTIYLPGINDREIEGIAKIASEYGMKEMFFQPCSVYRQNMDDLAALGFDFERAESMYEFVAKAAEVQERTGFPVKIPGCILVNLRRLREPEHLRFISRNAVKDSPPIVERDWKFVIDV